jgi:hypothetical protein
LWVFTHVEKISQKFKAVFEVIRGLKRYPVDNRKGKREVNSLPLVW